MPVSTTTLALILRRLRKNSTNWKKTDLTSPLEEEYYNKEINTIRLKKNTIGY
jgi:hypothetical protein